MAFPLEDFEYLRTTQPDVMQVKPYSEILGELNLNYTVLRARAGEDWQPEVGDFLLQAHENWAHDERTLAQYVEALFMSGHPLWAIGDDLKRSAQRNLIRPRPGESDSSLRRRILTAEAQAPFGSIPYIRNIMFAASELIVNTGVVVGANGRDHSCYALTSETGEGEASAGVLALVSAALAITQSQHESHTYTVETATKMDYVVTATLRYNRRAGIASDDILTAARASLERMMIDRRNLGYAIRLDDIRAALKVAGVEYSTISAPSADLVPADESTYYFGTDHTITISEA